MERNPVISSPWWGASSFSCLQGEPHHQNVCQGTCRVCPLIPPNWWSSSVLGQHIGLPWVIISSQVPRECHIKGTFMSTFGPNLFLLSLSVRRNRCWAHHSQLSIIGIAALALEQTRNIQPSRGSRSTDCASLE